MLERFKRSRWPEFTIEEIRKRSQILVIDDSEFYYLPLFEKDGYTITQWKEVEDLTKLESGYYDVVLLDIQGVGKDLSQEQGLGVLRHLRKVCPAQVIIAYSNADWSLKYQEFFNMADAVLAKSNDYVEFKRTVDKLLIDRFSLGFYVDRVTKMLAPYITDPGKARELASSAIQKRQPEKFRAFLQSCVEDKEVIRIVLQIVGVAIQIANLAK